MRWSILWILVASAWICVILPLSSLGQSPLPRLGVGIKASTLGIGPEGAMELTDRSNLRLGFNLFDYSSKKTKHGVNYDAELDLRSLQITYDQYLSGGFHVSPGLLAYNGTSLNASASVPPGQSFSLGGIRYFSSQTNPIAGSGTMSLRKAAPLVLFGVGNPLPRGGRHLGFNVEAGVVFQGSPTTKLNLSGFACAVSPSSGCVNAATDPTVQRNIQAEQDKLNSDLEPFKYFPVLSVGVSWKF